MCKQKIKLANWNILVVRGKEIKRDFISSGEESENMDPEKRRNPAVKRESVTNGKQKISRVILNDLKNWRTTSLLKS